MMNLSSIPLIEEVELIAEGYKGDRSEMEVGRGKMPKIIRVKAKNPFGRTKIPGAKFVINQYIGCIHACRYCYAKFMCKWYDHGEWGEWVVVRENLPELLRGKFVSGWVYMSSVSDAYQPIEKEIELTRRVLQSMNKNIRLRILTKSDFVLRDLDILKRFRRVEVGLTTNSFDEDLRSEIEPYAPSMERRFRALERLHDAGVRTYCFISPVIPGLTDFEYVVDRTKDFVDYYIVEFLNLRASGRFRRWLKENYPKSYETLLDRNALRQMVKKIRRMGVRIEDIVTHPQQL